MLANKLRVFTTKEELWVSQLHLVAVFIIIIIMKPPRARYIIWRRYYDVVSKSAHLFKNNGSAFARTVQRLMISPIHLYCMWESNGCQQRQEAPRNDCIFLFIGLNTGG